MDPSLEALWAKVQPLLYDTGYFQCFAVIAAILFAGQAFNFLRCRSATATETNHKVKVIISSWWSILLFCFFAFWGGRFSAVPIFF